MKEAQHKLVDLGDTKEIDLPEIDVKQHIGKTIKINKVEERQGNYGYFVFLETEIIETIKGGKDDIELKASKILGLQEDKEGNIGWGKDTKTGQFLKVYGVKHYNDLMGMDVKIQTTIKDGKEFLTF